MKVINIWQLQSNLYSLDKVGQEIVVVNTRTHKIALAFKVIKKPDQVKWKIEKDVITCTK